MIHGLNRWLAIAFGVVMILIVILTVAHGLPGDFFTAGKFSWTAFVSAAVTTGVLWQIAYAPYVSDYSRYMSPDKGVRAVFWYSYSGVVLGSAAPMMIGALAGL
jgi:NCS1 family nucleobase:cation symporter-1